MLIKAKMTSFKKLTIIVASTQAVGHVNSCAGALVGLLRRGHRVVFVVNQMFEGKLAPLGYLEYIFGLPNPELKMKANPSEIVATMLKGAKVIGPYDPLEKLQNMFKFFDSPEMLAFMTSFDDAIKEATEIYKPDLFYVDGNVMPAIYYSAIPWISSISPMPLFYYEGDDLPPGGAGLPIDSDPKDWKAWAEVCKATCISTNFNDLFEAHGYARYPDDTYPKNSVLTVYALPDELNYNPIRASPWFNLEVFSKNDLTKELQPLSSLVPETFLSDTLNGTYSGHLVYLSMGSMGSIDLDLMNRLVATLGKTHHKYIVSQGPLFEQYSLTANMWGAPFLPQTQILPHVDLVITHGGNNSVTETFAEGKPMIALGLFGDQFDNAQRLQETGYGIRMDPHSFTEEELISTVNRMLDDESLKQKCKAASERIKATNRHEELAMKIENLVA